ncbi:MAG: N-6 DNA methylase [Candidatus Cloacimonadaceae bacterium]|jgi:type I restriction enzyme M protein|nr:N-6 DNA methylase [Candidatus Cloacimonadaceae bacterium]
MLDTTTKRKIDDARDILVGKVPVPSSQVEQITIAMIYKFMYDMDNESIELGGNPKYFTGDFAQYAWNKLFDPKLSGEGRIQLYQDALAKIPNNAEIPSLFRDIFKNAFLPYRDPETLKLFLKCIDEFTYDHSEKLGDAFEYLLAVLGSQGDAGQFRTPRHIIDFMVELIDPQKEDSILDPACGTAGFLISAYKHILKTNSSNYDKLTAPHSFAAQNIPLAELVINGKKYSGDLLTPDQRAFLHQNIKGYDIAFEMVRLSLVNMYLHGFNTPQIYEYDTLTSTERWNEYANVILANPPFMTPKGGIRPHQKFTIQAKRSEVLFVDYMLEHLTNNGKAGIIVPEGIIFQSGKAYKQLRKLLVEENYLVGVISLPGGVFNPYSGVKTSILWIDKVLAKKTDKIIFLKINNDGFDLGAQRRPIEANDLPSAFANAMAYKEAILSQKDYAVPDKDVIVAEKTKLAENGDFNLSGERYATISVSQSQFPVVQLVEVCDIIAGQSPDGKYYNTCNEGTPFYQGKTEFTEKYLGKPTKWTTKTTKIAIPNDVVMSVRAPVGPVNIVQDKICIGRGLAAIRSKENVSYKYCFYMLHSLENSIKGTSGSTFASINKAEIEKIQIPLPPLSVQEEIVAELDSYQKIIDGAKQVVDNWKPHIDIDPGWEEVELGDVCTFVRGPFGGSLKKEIFVKSGYCVYEQQHAIYGDFDRVRYFITEDKYQEMKRFTVSPGEIIMSCSGTMGKVAIIPDNAKPGIINQALLKLHPSDRVLSEYLSLILAGADFQKELIGQSIGVAIVNVPSVKTLKNTLIPLPNLTVQHSIVNHIEKEQKLVDANQELIILYKQKIKDRIEKLWIQE